MDHQTDQNITFLVDAWPDIVGFFARADNNLLRSFSLSDDFLLNDHALKVQ